MKFKAVLCVLMLALSASACFGPSEEQRAQRAQQAQKDAELKREVDEIVKAHQEWKEQHKEILQPKPLPPLPPQTPVTTLTHQTPTRPTRPEIGMALDDFKSVCGPPSPRTDDLRTYETSYGYTSAYRYEYTEDRGAKGCWGMFTFRDFKLVSVYR